MVSSCCQRKGNVALFSHDIVRVGGAQFEARVPTSGDVLFREQLPSAIVHVASVDFRGEGRPHVVVCTADGAVRGYSSVDKLSKVLQAKHDEAHLDQVRHKSCSCGIGHAICMQST